METATSKANLPATLSEQRRQEIMAKVRGEFRGGTKVPFIQQIKMKNVKNPLDQFEKGEWYTIKENDEGEKVYESIGTEPEVVILKRCYSYSMYDKDNEKMLAWTNEIDGFSAFHNVCVVSMEHGKPEAAFVGDFKKFQAAKKDIERQLGYKFKFVNVLYVLYKDEVYRLIVSGASVTGVKDGEKYGSYQDVQPGSLEDFKNYIVSSESECYFFTRCKLGHKFLKKNEYYVSTFTTAGAVADAERDRMLLLFSKVEDTIQKLFMVRFAPLLAGRPETDDSVPESAVDDKWDANDDSDIV